MKRNICCPLFVLVALLVLAPQSGAQSGSIEFNARVTPSGGVEEPVRGFPFYLLSKSYEEIAKEVDASEPKPDMDAFIDKLDSRSYSPELKAWMKKHSCVSFAGDEFIKKLTADDILHIPEFRKAYMDRNAGDQSVNFPKSKANPADEKKHPEKFKKASDEYAEAVHHFIDQHPETVDGIDLGLSEIDPGSKWSVLLKKRVPEVQRRTVDLAESKYLIARTQTDLQGQAVVENLPAGTYWISTLDVVANVGDARPRWNVPVRVTPGRTQYVALSNANSIHSPVSSN